MKKKILFGLSLLALIFYVSCGKDDDPTPDPEVSISSFSPEMGEPDAEVSIIGKNFNTKASANTVKFNGTTATVTSATATQLKTTVPNGATTGKITVTVGSSTATSSSDFTVLEPQPAPQITGFSPPIVTKGDFVTIEGSNFGSDNQQISVYINEVQASIDWFNTAQIKIQVPADATTGKIKVVVGDQTATSSENLIIVFSPSINGFSPKEGEWGTKVVIDGANFSDTGNTVTINGVEAEIVNESSSQIEVNVPENSRTGPIVVSTSYGNSIDSDEDFTVFHGSWTQIADFGGGIRRDATAFVLDGVPYVGLGTGGTLIPDMDFWTYNHESDEWIDLNLDFSGYGHIGNSSFVIGQKAYITPGFLMNTGYGSDFWSFEPLEFTSIIDIFEGIARYNAVAFSIGTKGYYGTGNGEGGVSLKDFWEYNPGTGDWIQKADMGGETDLPRYAAIGVALEEEGKGYVGGGYSVNQNDDHVPVKDFWEYDPNMDSWTRKADIGGLEAPVRASPTAFTIGNKIYVGLGYDDNDNNLYDFWEYDSTTDTWVKVANFPGAPREKAVAFVLDGKAYVGLGYDGDQLSDFWVFDPGN
ncbi:IPT/TIG domain-containing protein [Flagellimonas nanhaiensis]|nr:IPT/TIG domain-containing protein [Allomuricauda nanhaiensis]